MRRKENKKKKYLCIKLTNYRFSGAFEVSPRLKAMNANVKDLKQGASDYIRHTSDRVKTRNQPATLQLPAPPALLPSIVTRVTNSFSSNF